MLRVIERVLKLQPVLDFALLLLALQNGIDLDVLIDLLLDFLVEFKREQSSLLFDFFDIYLTHLELVEEQILFLQVSFQSSQ